ncbi:MAG: hypothetical protein A2142_02430 [candidate division Zixibacteria bacterium RBG_16_48_11]|nr:MAG: hypothetical protein A2142_02430 [candidate division Zixibacteria bacterium RBG_16_48_11]
MLKSSSGAKIAGISDEAVKKKTGRTWNQWIAILDKAGAKQMNHTRMAAYLYKQQKLPGWWAQMVTVGYEQARGLREKHQRPEGYSVSASRVVNVPLSTLYHSWAEAKQRDKWLKVKRIEVRKATANKSIRITWSDKKSSLEVNFYDKGKSKTQVVVQHSKLKDAKAAEKMKGYWAKKLDGLKAFLE